MIKKLFIFILLLLLLGIAFYAPNFLFDQQISVEEVEQELLVEQVGDIKFINDNLESFTIAVFNQKPEVTFIAENARSIKEQSIQNDWKLSTNAGFIRGEYLDAEHAGLLFTDNTLIEPLVIDATTQLSHIMYWDDLNDTINHQTTSTFELTDNISWAFQTGPIIINDGQLQRESINSSINGEQSTLRTVLGKTRSGEFFLMVSKIGYTLEDLGNKITQMPELGEVDFAMNLDGGKSTSMYSQQAEYNFLPTKRIPALIGIR